MISDGAHPKSPIVAPTFSLNPDAPVFRSSNNYGDINFYPYSTPDPSIHGEGPFVAALPARNRIPASSVVQLDQRPMWHPDASRVGELCETDSVFIKQRKDGSISLLYEQQLRQRGVHGYRFTIVDGVISASDGVGFVFADRVPCSKNIKRLWSVFTNRTGSIVKRMGPQLVRSASPLLPPLAVGQALSLVLDLNQFRATFQSESVSGVVLARASVDLSDIAERVDCSRGYLCAAVTRAGMVVQLDKAPVELLDLPEIQLSSEYRYFYGHPHLRYQMEDVPCWDMPEIPRPSYSQVDQSQIQQNRPIRPEIPVQPHVIPAPRIPHFGFGLDPLSPSEISHNSSPLGPTEPHIRWPLNDSRPKDSFDADSLSRSASVNNDLASWMMFNASNQLNTSYRLNNFSSASSNLLTASNLLGCSPNSDVLLSSSNILDDPAVLSVDNRGISTSSNSSMFVGGQHPTTLQEASELLMLLGHLREPRIDVYDDAVELSRNWDPLMNDKVPSIREDDTSDLLQPMALAGNRTVSAPPGGSF